MPDPIPSAHFFPFQTQIISSVVFPSHPIHPCRPIQLIFSRRKYESTKINLSCLRIRSAVPLSRQNTGLHMLVTLLKPCLVLSFSFVLFQSVEGRRCVSAVRAVSPACGEMFVQASHMLFVHVYVGTTCYSQGYTSLRPVSPCVYSSSRLLPPDYKKDWWINNIQLSPAVSHSLQGLEVCRHMCVCSRPYLYRCLCGCVCDGMCACLVSLASLSGPGSPSCGWFPGPLLAGSRQKSIPTRAEPGTNMGREGKASSSSSASGSVHTILSVPALVCETLENREDRETSREKEGGSKEHAYSPLQHWRKKNFSDRLSLTLSLLNRQEMWRHSEENDYRWIH